MRLLRRFAPHNDRLKKCAFTLAELMITIGIIGVVAAITIPLLIQNSNYKKFTTQFRKSLSTLNQAAISAQAQYDMDYGTLTSDSSASTCATDSLSGGQSTMCGLLNNTLAGKTYMGVYGEVAGSMILTKYKFTKKTDGFDPANFLIYSMADGSIVGFNPSMKNCSLNGELTKSVLTDSNKLANCIGFIDVNGVSLPNKEVTCSDGTSALEPNNPCTLKSKPWGLGDVFPVVFHNGTVEPATNAAKAFFSGESSGEEQISNSSASVDPAIAIYKPDVTSSGEPIWRNENGRSLSFGCSDSKCHKTIDGVDYVLNGGYYWQNYSGRVNLYFPKDTNGNVDISKALGENNKLYLYDSEKNVYYNKNEKGEIEYLSAEGQKFEFNESRNVYLACESGTACYHAYNIITRDGYYYKANPQSYDTVFTRNGEFTGTEQSILIKDSSGYFTSASKKDNANYNIYYESDEKDSSGCYSYYRSNSADKPGEKGKNCS